MDLTPKATGDIRAIVDRLSAGLEWVHKSPDFASQMLRDLDAATALIEPAFEKILLQHRTLTYIVRDVFDRQTQLLEFAERSRAAHLLVSAELPKRGWYLSGQEPCTLTDRISNALENDDWDRVDQEVMDHLPEYDPQTLRSWMAEAGVPDFCVDRLFRFLEHHRSGNYEEAAFLGVPLIDEIAQYLYVGKTFTTKRGNRSRGSQTKPELAFKTAGAPELTKYCNDFVLAFGSLQEDPIHAKLDDANYWNRHAIVHGMMRRPMGIKDSAKCLMAINFLIFARDEDSQPTETD